jgi:hypothetical protein
MSRRRRPRIADGGQFVPHTREMRESFAWRFLPNNARRVLDRLELEHMHHGGAENGSLICTYSDFEKSGLRRQSIALAIRQCVALGFLEITRQGQRCASDFNRVPAQYFLTYLRGVGKSLEATDAWRRVHSDVQAKQLLSKAQDERRYDTQPTTRRSLGSAAPSPGEHVPSSR